MIAIPAHLVDAVCRRLENTFGQLLFFQCAVSAVEWPWHRFQAGVHVATGERGMLDMGSDLRIALFGGYDIGLPIASPERILVITVDLGKSNWFNGAPETGRAEVLRAQR